MENRNTATLVLLTALSALLHTPTFSYAGDPIEEVPIANIFIPAHGFDDNDNIQVTLDVVLPDPCYTFTSTNFDINPATSEISLHAYAWRRNDGVCKPGDLLEPTNISVVQDLGRLQSSKYKLTAIDPNGMNVKKSFEVALAKTTTLDDLSYALVTNIIVNEFFAPSEVVKVKITGRFDPACEKVNKNPKFWVDLDSIVITPTISRIPGAKCGSKISQFDRILTIGKLKVGTYLVHARSKNGTSVNHVFQVLAQ